MEVITQHNKRKQATIEQLYVPHVRSQTFQAKASQVTNNLFLNNMENSLG
jgi:hypothetical protein